MEKLRIGVIGVGNMGTGHVTYLNEGKVTTATIAAVCDIKQDRLDWVESLNPEIKRYNDYHDLLNSGEVDAVIVATPHYLHPVIGEEAFAAGLHVLTEKPAGVYTKQVHEFMDVAKKSGKTFGVMLNQRTEPYYQKIRSMVQGGELGELKRCVWIITNWYRTQSYYNSGGWRATYAGEGGGVLLNQAPHNLDLWQWVFGMPNRIRAFATVGKYHDIEVEDDVTAYAEYPNGATGVFITTTGEYPGTNRLEISGSKGKLVYEFGKLTFYRLSQDERKYCFEADDGFTPIEYEEIDVKVDGVGKNHRQIVQNFSDHILSGTPLLAPGYDGVRSLTISNAMMLSQWKNDWVDITGDTNDEYGRNFEDEYWQILQEKIKGSRVKTNVVEKVADLGGTYNSK